jgi:hypothetical protein
VSRSYERRIAPANLADLPSVLNTQDVSNVLRVSPGVVQRMAREGELPHLDYSRNLLFAASAIRRYLREHSVALKRAAGGDAA